jgi:adenosylhomocysteinase
VEIDIPALEKLSIRRRKVRDCVEEFTLRSKKRIYLIAEGRLVNLASAEGHPASVMDMSFANQALASEYIVLKGHSLQKKVYPVPEPIDAQIAFLKLKAMEISIDHLTSAQKTYLQSWDLGT